MALHIEQSGSKPPLLDPAPVDSSVLPVSSSPAEEEPPPDVDEGPADVEEEDPSSVVLMMQPDARSARQDENRNR